MKIGIFGGSFNPVHTGHMIVANYCAQFTNLDQVWLMVSPCNPLKQDRSQAPQDLRYAMCSAATSECENIIASNFEFSLPYPSYTYSTLKLLSLKYPSDEFTLIIGADNWEIFNKWKDYDKIIREYDIIIYPRPGYTLKNSSLPERVKLIEDADAPLAFISSTFVRNAVKAGKNINYFVPTVVKELIEKENLYGSK